VRTSDPHQWRKTNPDKERKAARARYAANPEFYRQKSLRFYHEHKGAEELRLRRLRKLEELAGRPCPEVCEVCHQPNSDSRGRNLHFDHDHGTGTFRGWLCINCNHVLGKVHDDPERLRALADYLEVSRLTNDSSADK
jgi:hypothetical protein